MRIFSSFVLWNKTVGERIVKIPILIIREVHEKVNLSLKCLQGDSS